MITGKVEGRSRQRNTRYSFLQIFREMIEDRKIGKIESINKVGSVERN